MTSVTRLLALTAAASLGTAPVYAATLWVATNGTDTPACGPNRNQPCRSISAGIAHANIGDLVLVGPGRYGDIDGDLQYVTPGDEAVDLGRGCLVCITKRVTVASTDGADLTVIDPGSPGPGQSFPAELRWSVIVAASGVRFGAPGQGFSIYGLPGGALSVDSVGDIRVIGNVTYGGGMGMDVNPLNGPAYVAQNRLLNADSGLQVGLRNSQGTVVDNFAGTNQGGGIHVGVSDLGAAPPPLVANNRALGNLAGFTSFSSPPGNNIRVTMAGNVAVGNKRGFLSETSGISFQRNTAIGGLEGFLVVGQPGWPDNSFHTNNMIGNFRCGFWNRGGITHVDATNNFWGSAAGPGPKPSDAVCNELGTSTSVVPFATRAF